VDPLTHGLLGAAVAQAALPAPESRKALLLGAAAGMLADGDVLLRVVSDPALPWEVHRHATHALLFSPLGGLLAALPFLIASSAWRARWRAVVFAATLAYATHGLLDACTSYGTSLFLPFSSARAAWDVIAILDPLFTLMLGAGMLLAAWRLRKAPAFAALALCAAYLGLGWRQHAAAMDEVLRLAASRGHVVERALPTPMNLVVWRGLYVAQGRIFADGGRVPILGAARFTAGTSVPLPAPEAGPSSGRADARAARIADVEARFERFADGFAARDPERPDVLADMRYSLEVASFSPLWGIRVGASNVDGDPVSWVDLAADRRASLRRMWEDLRRH
jgi:inner membrane protein